MMMMFVSFFSFTLIVHLLYVRLWKDNDRLEGEIDSQKENKNDSCANEYVNRPTEGHHFLCVNS